MTTLNNI